MQQPILFSFICLYAIEVCLCVCVCQETTTNQHSFSVLLIFYCVKWEVCVCGEASTNEVR